MESRADVEGTDEPLNVNNNREKIGICLSVDLGFKTSKTHILNPCLGRSKHCIHRCYP